MTNNQHGQVPEALQLADEISKAGAFPAYPRAPYEAAAAELRRLHAENAALRTQQPAPAAGITVEQVEDAIGLQSTAWDTIGAEKIVEAVLRLANAKAPAAGAVAGPDGLDGAFDQYKIDAASTPPAQAAQSVMEDAARLDWLALAGPTSICLVIDRPHDSEVEVSTDDVTGYGKTLREALDAARKYHRAQTRPIDRTDEAITAGRARLGRPHD